MGVIWDAYPLKTKRRPPLTPEGGAFTTDHNLNLSGKWGYCNSMQIDALLRTQIQANAAQRVLPLPIKAASREALRFTAELRVSFASGSLAALRWVASAGGFST